MRELLDELDKDVLIDFLVKYAENDTKFVNAVNVHFVAPEFAIEIEKIKNEIDNALDGVTDYRTHDGWGNAIFDVYDIIAEIIQRKEQGYVRLAFAEIELLYRRLVECLEYQGECEINDKAEYCLEIMSEIADKAVCNEDKEYIHKHCIELTELKDPKNYGLDDEKILLKIITKVEALATPVISELPDISSG